MTTYDFSINLADETTSHTWMLFLAAGARSVLEIGCATGFFSRYLVARGCRVVGVEQDRSAAQQAQQVCQQVIIGDIESAATQEHIAQLSQHEGRFDTVILGDVLEHLREPDMLLRHIRARWLQPDGRVIVSVPNAGHWIFRREVLLGRFPYRQYGLFDRTHLRFFTRSSLFAMVAACGYHIEHAAITANHNSHDDLTIASLAWLYRRRPDFRRLMIDLEHRLALRWPQLFAYQFVLSLRPAAPGTRYTANDEQ